MSDDENNDIRILGFTEHEVELVLMSVQCIKGSDRYKTGWEVGMENFASLTNTSVRDARARWKDLSSRLMKLPRLRSEKSPPHARDESEEVIEDCIVVKGESGDESCDEDADGGDAEGGQKAKRKARAKGKGKRVAKPSILENIEVDIDEEHNVGATDGQAQAGSKGGGSPESPIDQDRIKKAWDDIGDDMTEEKWNEMGDEHAL